MIEAALREALRADVAERLFARPAHGRRMVGVEAELLAVDAATLEPAPILGHGRPGTYRVIESFARGHGWREERIAGRHTRFVGPQGDVLSWEPGGQLELSSRPCAGISELAQAVETTLGELRRRAGDAGILLVAAGVDPWNPLERAPLQLETPRYLAMASYFRALSAAGEQMMRQTAALQVNIDPGDDAPLLWRVLNAAAPLLVAMFARSPAYAGSLTGERSHRAALWRRLDPARTGLLRGQEDAVDEYLGFALAAGAMHRVDEDGRHRPMGDWIARGAVSDAEWRTHLTTLFPEVRPRRFLELRSCDAVEPEWVVAPLVLATGIAWHPPSLRAAAELLGAADESLLERAGRCALRDPALSSLAASLAGIALAGCSALGEAHVSGDDLERARDFFARYTFAGRSPADDLEAELEASSASGRAPFTGEPGRVE